MKSLTLNHETFSEVKAGRRGAAILVNDENTKYLRIGEPTVLGRELAFHQELLKYGFPVAPILDTGTLDDHEYSVEASLGPEHFSALFAADLATSGHIEPTTFAKYIAIIEQFRAAQIKTERLATPVDWASFLDALHVSTLKEELPDFAHQIDAAVTKAATELASTPFCLTHGDLTTHNILPGGVIDFGDHFTGPSGFDLVNALSTPFWFPQDDTIEFHKMYSFSDAEVASFIDHLGTIPHFDALFFLKSIWWDVKNHTAPKLQAWRHHLFRQVTDSYLNNESLFTFYLDHKDD